MRVPTFTERCMYVTEMTGVVSFDALRCTCMHSGRKNTGGCRCSERRGRRTFDLLSAQPLWKYLATLGYPLTLPAFSRVFFGEKSLVFKNQYARFVFQSRLLSKEIIPYIESILVSGGGLETN